MDKKRRNKQIGVITEEKNDGFPVEKLAQTLATQIEEKIKEDKYASTMEVLTLAGAGLFMGTTLATFGLTRSWKYFRIRDDDEDEVSKQFNIPYLKRSISRLERQKLVEYDVKDGKEIIKVTRDGKRKILKYALENLSVKKPARWNGRWWLVSYDIPKELAAVRHYFHDYLMCWGFYPLHESVFLHAYPCRDQVEFLKEYLGIGDHVRILEVKHIDDDRFFKQFFGI